MGSHEAKSDTEIFKREPNRSSVIEIESDNPIGYKAHFLREIHFRDRICESGSIGMIFLTRDPVSAIASQTTRILGNRRKFPLLTQRRKRLVIQDNIDLYLSLVFRFAAFDDAPKIHIKFEDLLNAESSEKTVKRLLSVVGAKLEGPKLNDVFALAKDSQKSLSNYKENLRVEIEKEVEKKIVYSEVLQYINKSA